MNSLAPPPPPPPPPVPVPARALAVDPNPPFEVGEFGSLDEPPEEGVEPPEPDLLADADGVRETRDVADLNAADPPPVCSPFVEVMVGAADPSCEEPPEDELDVLPGPPREFDCITSDLPLLLGAPPRELPSRPLPLRFPRSRGVIKEANFSAPVVPVRRMVRSMVPSVTAAVRIRAAVPAVGTAVFCAKCTPRSMPITATIRNKIHPNRFLPEDLGACGTSRGGAGDTPGVGARLGADAPPLMWECIGNP
jgi:hypothetical protein